jgi:hypothetical protein
MTVTCADFDRILESEDSSLRAELEAHAAHCADCRERLDLWNEISRTAPLLRETWESPALWPRIESELRKGRGAESGIRRPKLRLNPRRLTSPAVLWLAAAAAFAVFLPLAWTALNVGRPPAPEHERRLLSEKALEDVEKNEEAYVRSIDRLSELAEPLLETSDSPLVMNYREKLKLIDSAITECRAQAEGNPFNAHLRAELLSMYQEKQRTLQTVLKENPGDL